MKQQIEEIGHPIAGIDIPDRCERAVAGKVFPAEIEDIVIRRLKQGGPVQRDKCLVGSDCLHFLIDRQGVVAGGGTGDHTVILIQRIYDLRIGMRTAGDDADQPVHGKHLLLEDAGGGTAVLRTDDIHICAVMNGFRQPGKPLLLCHPVYVFHHRCDGMHQIFRVVRMVRIGMIGGLVTDYLLRGVLECSEGFISDGFDEALYRASGGIALLRNLVNTHVRDAVEILEKILCEDHVGVAFIIGIQNRKKGSPRIKPDRIVLLVFPGGAHISNIYHCLLFETEWFDLYICI